MTRQAAALLFSGGVSLGFADNCEAFSNIDRLADATFAEVSS